MTAPYSGSVRHLALTAFVAIAVFTLAACGGGSDSPEAAAADAGGKDTPSLQTGSPLDSLEWSHVFKVAEIGKQIIFGLTAGTNQAYIDKYGGGNTAGWILKMLASGGNMDSARIEYIEKVVDQMKVQLDHLELAVGFIGRQLTAMAANIDFKLDAIEEDLKLARINESVDKIEQWQTQFADVYLKPQKDAAGQYTLYTPNDLAAAKGYCDAISNVASGVPNVMQNIHDGLVGNQYVKNGLISLWRDRALAKIGTTVCQPTAGNPNVCTNAKVTPVDAYRTMEALLLQYYMLQVRALNMYYEAIHCNGGAESFKGASIFLNEYLPKQANAFLLATEQIALQNVETYRADFAGGSTWRILPSADALVARLLNRNGGAVVRLSGPASETALNDATVDLSGAGVPPTTAAERNGVLIADGVPGVPYFITGVEEHKFQTANYHRVKRFTFANLGVTSADFVQGVLPTQVVKTSGGISAPVGTMSIPAQNLYGDPMAMQDVGVARLDATDVLDWSRFKVTQTSESPWLELRATDGSRLGIRGEGRFGVVSRAGTPTCALDYLDDPKTPTDAPAPLNYRSARVKCRATPSAVVQYLQAETDKNNIISTTDARGATTFTVIELPAADGTRTIALSLVDASVNSVKYVYADIGYLHGYFAASSLAGSFDLRLPATAWGYLTYGLESNWGNPNTAVALAYPNGWGVLSRQWSVPFAPWVHGFAKGNSMAWIQVAPPTGATAAFQLKFNWNSGGTYWVNDRDTSETNRFVGFFVRTAQPDAALPGTEVTKHQLKLQTAGSVQQLQEAGAYASPPIVLDKQTQVQIDFESRDTNTSFFNDFFRGGIYFTDAVLSIIDP